MKSPTHNCFLPSGDQNLGRIANERPGNSWKSGHDISSTTHCTVGENKAQVIVQIYLFLMPILETSLGSRIMPFYVQSNQVTPSPRP